jgi:hypothetical protein
MKAKPRLPKRGLAAHGNPMSMAGCRQAALTIRTGRLGFAKSKPRRGAGGVLLDRFAATRRAGLSSKRKKSCWSSWVATWMFAVGCQTNGLVSISRTVCIGFSRRGRLLAVDLFSTCDLGPPFTVAGLFYIEARAL